VNKGKKKGRGYYYVPALTGGDEASLRLLFPAVGLLADVLDRRGADVPPTRYAMIRVVVVVELSLRVQVILGQRFLVGL
jgi:hypothetical protein